MVGSTANQIGCRGVSLASDSSASFSQDPPDSGLGAARTKIITGDKEEEEERIAQSWRNACETIEPYKRTENRRLLDWRPIERERRTEKERERDWHRNMPHGQAAARVKRSLFLLFLAPFWFASRAAKQCGATARRRRPASSETVEPVFSLRIVIRALEVAERRTEEPSGRTDRQFVSLPV